MRFGAYLSLAAALAIAGCNSKSDVEAMEFRGNEFRGHNTN